MNDDPQTNSISPDVGGIDSESQPLDRDVVQAVFDLHAQRMKSFLLGVLKDDAEANDAIQATFVQLMEKGHTIKSGDLMGSAAKSWLYRVAFNQAMLVKRKRKVAVRHQEKVAWLLDSRLKQGQSLEPSEATIRDEQFERVRRALEQLPEEQKLIVRTRIHEGLKFREIAEQFDIPLGTVLSRMQAGLKRLRLILQEE